MNESRPGILSTLLSSGASGSSLSSGFFGDFDDVDSFDDLGSDDALEAADISLSKDPRRFFDLDDTFFLDFLRSESLEVRFFFDFCCISPYRSSK